MPTAATEPVELWPELKLSRAMLDNHRAFPHAFLRSALFSSRKFSGGAKRQIASADKPIHIAALNNYRLQQVAGERLDQGDCEVYVWLVNRAYRAGLAGKAEARIFFTREEALSELGRARGTKNFNLFHASLLRLFKAEIAYDIPSAEGCTRLISSIEKPKGVSKKKYDYEVVLSAKGGDFFRGQSFTKILNEERAKLKDYLSKWLHAFYSSHNLPHRIKADTIKELADRTKNKGTGDQIETPEFDKIWRSKLDAALGEVKKVTGWPTCEVVQDGNGSAKVIVIKPPVKPKSRKSREGSQDAAGRKHKNTTSED